jgi:hypothetical protein
VHNTDFLTLPRFQNAYRSGKLTGSWGTVDLEWRVHVCVWLAKQAARLDGDFVECGTNRGGTATAVLEYLADDPHFEGKRFICFDTFEGLSSSHSSTSELAHYDGLYQDCFADVLLHFERYPQVELVRGPIPDTLHEYPCTPIAFIHIDLNSAAPEAAAAEFFWPHLVPGAYMLLDDFAWQASVGQREMFKEFAAARDVEILWLPTGQGLIQKP